MNMCRARLLATTTALAGLALRAAPAEEEPKQMPDMVVSAVRSEVSTKEIPANITVITAEEIAKGNYTDVVSVLKRRAGLHFRSFSGNQEAAVDIRGFGENSFGRVLILRDGRKLNRPDMRSINWSQIPLANVERIEVTRGPNGAMYGDQAVGGVINIITKKGGECPTGEVIVEGGSERFNRQVLTTVGRLGPLDYALSLERAGSEGWRDRTGTRTEGGDLSLGYDLTEGLRLDVNISALRTDFEMPGALFEPAYSADPAKAGNPDDEATTDFFAINPTLAAQLGPYAELILDLGYSRKDIKTDQVSWFSWTNLLIETYAVSPRIVVTAPVGELANRLTVGLDWTRDSLDLERYFDANRTVYGGGADVTKDTLAAYINDALNLTDTLIVSAGARFGKSVFAVAEEDGTGASTTDQEKTHREQAYHLGLTWNASETTKLFAKYEHFYRFPFLDEHSGYSWGGGTFNKDLEPETGDSYEVGIEQQLPGNVTIAATLFRMEMQDEIAPVLWVNVNLDQTVHQGLELSVTADPLTWLSLYTNYTFQEVEFDAGANDGNELPLVPKHKVNAGIEVRPLESLRANLDATYTSHMYEGGDNANALDQMDDYIVVDLGLAYSLELGKTSWEIFGGIDNLLDEGYTDFVFWSGHYAAPGRTYKAGVKVAF